MAELYVQRKLPHPTLNPGDEPYFAGAAEGRLLLKQCEECGSAHHYPRSLCPVCFSDRVDWVSASGRGVIYSYSVTRRAEPGPHCIAYITLEEGITILSGVVDCDLDLVRIGQPVQVVFKETTGGLAVPMFTLTSA